jgi:hypothetical protein
VSRFVCRGFIERIILVAKKEAITKLGTDNKRKKNEECNDDMNKPNIPAEPVIITKIAWYFSELARL